MEKTAKGGDKMDTHPCPNCGKEVHQTNKCTQCGKVFCGDFNCGGNGCPNCGNGSHTVSQWNPIENKWD